MVSAKEIPPGGEGKIDVTFKTQRRKGVNRKKITVNSNDPTNPRLQLEIVADLEVLLDASPRRIWFGRLKQDEMITKSFSIEGRELDKLQLSNFHLKSDKFTKAVSWKVEDVMMTETDVEKAKAKDDEKKKDEKFKKDPSINRQVGRNILIHVTLDGSEVPPGRFNEVLLVDSNVKEVPELELHLSGEILGPISSNPKRLYFGQYEKNVEMVKTMTLTANNNVPFKVLEVNCDDQEFKIEPWKSGDALEHTLTVRLTPKLERDRIRSSLKIVTSMEKQKDITVDIHAYQRRTRPGNPPPGTKIDSSSHKKAVPMADVEKNKLERDEMRRLKKPR